MPNRTYGEEELRELMRLATEKQHLAMEGSGKIQISLDEAKKIARELGIDPVFVEQAAMDMTGDAVDSDELWVNGSPHAYRMRRRLPGSYEEDDLGEFAQIIRRHSGSDAGHVETFGTTLHWRGAGSIKKTVDMRKTDDGDVELEGSVRLGDIAWSLHIATILTTVTTLLALVGGRMDAALVTSLMTVVLFFAMRAGFRWISRRASQNMESMFAELESRIVLVPRREEIGVGPSARIDLDDSHEQDDAVGTSRSRRKDRA